MGIFRENIESSFPFTDGSPQRKMKTVSISQGIQARNTEPGPFGKRCALLSLTPMARPAWSFSGVSKRAPARLTVLTVSPALPGFQTRSNKTTAAIEQDAEMVSTSHGP